MALFEAHVKVQQYSMMDPLNSAYASNPDEKIINDWLDLKGKRHLTNPPARAMLPNKQMHTASDRISQIQSQGVAV